MLEWKCETPRLQPCNGEVDPEAHRAQTLDGVFSIWISFQGEGVGWDSLVMDGDGNQIVVGEFNSPTPGQAKSYAESLLRGVLRSYLLELSPEKVPPRLKQLATSARALFGLDEFGVAYVLDEKGASQEWVPVVDRKD